MQGAAFHMRLTFKRSEHYQLRWTQLQPPVGFTVLQHDVAAGARSVLTQCELDAPLEAGGSRRLFDLAGTRGSGSRFVHYHPQ